MRRLAVIALGSNRGERLAVMRRAVGAVSSLGERTTLRVSGLYETPALTLAGVGELGDADTYLNAVLTIETTREARALLDGLLEIERSLGRGDRGRSERWAPRTIDLDLLMLGDVRVSEPGLTLPHPRITERWFVLRPLADVLPEWTLRGSDGQRPRRVSAWLSSVEGEAFLPERDGRLYAAGGWWEAGGPTQRSSSG